MLLNSCHNLQKTKLPRKAILQNLLKNALHKNPNSWDQIDTKLYQVYLAWVFGGKYEQRRKRRMILSEGILYLWGEIKQTWKRNIMFRKGKYIFHRTKLGKKTEKYIWIGKYVFSRGEDKQQRKRRKISGEGKCVFFL